MPPLVLFIISMISAGFTSELKKDWNDNLAAIFEAKLKAAMKAKPPKYDLFSKALFYPLTSCFRASYVLNIF